MYYGLLFHGDKQGTSQNNEIFLSEIEYWIGILSTEFLFNDHKILPGIVFVIFCETERIGMEYE